MLNICELRIRRYSSPELSGDSAERFCVSRAALFQEGLCFFTKELEVDPLKGIRRCGHSTPPVECPCPHIGARCVAGQFWVRESGGKIPFRGRDAPCCAGWIIAQPPSSAATGVGGLLYGGSYSEVAISLIRLVCSSSSLSLASSFSRPISAF